ncbi:MAG: bifunctional folylpolyglutamate synthase/dihydrofolate synthase [Planifilum sp.]|jgi:dihydrofolate synthase/folylpolyglutamate synthase
MGQQRFVTKEDVFRWMEKGCATGIQPGLERMEWALERLGHPEKRLKFIHIAGTNGKGSTAAMIAQVLRQAGYSTGMFISPYVTDWNERISLDGRPIPDSSLVRWAEHLRPVVEEMDREVGKPTPFEFWTLLALCYFAREAVPWFVVWEAGLGGRWDSTNVAFPLVSVITNVGLDHIHLLGNTLGEIAEEKAGIIKPGVPVVSGAEDPEAIRVIEKRARENKADLYLLHRDFQVKTLESGPENQRFQFGNVYRTLSDLELPLMGEHQVKNAAVALMTLDLLRQFYATVLEEEDIREGLSATDWPGRLEKVAAGPDIWLDGAHNREAARALAESVPEILRSHTYERLHLVISVSADKEVDEILKPLLPLADLVVVTRADHSRALPVEALAEAVRRVSPETRIREASTAAEGLRFAKEDAGDRAMILVTGSLFLVSEVRKWLLTN